MVFFFFNDTATTEIYSLSLHDALPIAAELGRPLVLGRVGEQLVGVVVALRRGVGVGEGGLQAGPQQGGVDRKSTRLNSSHANISYAVFCLNKQHTADFPSFHALGGRIA